MPSSRGFVTSHDGTRISVAEGPGAPPPLLMVHATGFCKEVWEPVVAELRAAGSTSRIVAVDQRVHGDSGVLPPPFDWWDAGRDLLAVVAALDLEGAVGVGHSSGAAALAIAELSAPGTFTRLVLIEPIIFPPPYTRIEDHPLTVGALKRRPTFESPQEAWDRYHRRGPFTHWDDRALVAYLRGGLRRSGTEWRLKCTPENEAEFYRGATVHGAWSRLGEIEIPVTLVAGQRSDSHPRRFVEEQAARFGDASLAIVPDATHFVPMERPRAVADVVAAHVAAPRNSG